MRHGKTSPKSIKDQHARRAEETRRVVTSKTNLGSLMAKYPLVEEVLYSKTTNLDMVFEEMDFSVAEFCEITMCDLEELLGELEDVIRKRS
jgi:hypothetical protein